ncbi:DUF202 domain-containing protein [Streptomyces sp. MUM 203J]|uniref:DUF202 domain-containing protein n=1 Tax=Streptomyces sp. MUM 203J TaxID=2791990 RepID=UPI001F03E29F|nr:DUF202 domain-containing protein [Streptomyces sp. MUM 203J]MCH0539489.1 DUF202 domain-containing protein [Streptomyces sp. MUM 203J]
MTVAGGSRDPGLQPERTRLAWRRTTLSCTVAAALAARQAVHEGPTAAGVLGAGLSLLVWVGFLVVADRRMRALGTARPGAMSLRVAVVAAACTVALAAFAVGVVV